jgi:CHASE2 domain-containing sensor protein
MSTMSSSGTLIVLNLTGELAFQGFQVTAEINDGQLFRHTEVKGVLPACPDLAEALSQWQHIYRNLGPDFRIRPKAISYMGQFGCREDCHVLAVRLKEIFQDWLMAASFRPVDQYLREIWRDGVRIQVMVRSQDAKIHHLPWHLWDLIDRYAQTEVIFGPTEFRKPTIYAADKNIHPGKVKILVILGHSEGIDTAADLKVLKQLPDAEVVFLSEPDRQNINGQLWDQPWDILFFAGHSQTEDVTGHIYINPHDSLTLEELKYGLRQATARGLQLAIFNSCDGLGLAHALTEINLPHMIFMREPVPDPIAQRFLQYFLKVFSAGIPLVTAIRQAREQLQGLEQQFPCASWLPVIHQYPGLPSLTWQTLRDKARTPALLPVGRKQASTPINRRLKHGIGMMTVVVGGLVATLLTMGLRSTNLLQSWEFYGFDQMVRLLPTEAPDPRVVVVEITRADIENGVGEYPLEDATLLQLLQTLETKDPAVIGVDIYRDRPEGEGYAALQSYLNRQEQVVPLCAHPYSSDPRGVAPPPNVDAAQLGFADVMIDQDGTVRRHLLALDPSSTSPCPAFYSLSTQLALRYLASKGTQLTFPQDNQWQLGETRFQILGRHQGFYQSRATNRGHQILLRYRSYNTVTDIVERMSLEQVVAGDIAPEQIQGRVVLIGNTDPTVKDYFRTPHTPQLRGLLLHAQMTSQLISAVEDERSLLRFWPFWADLLWVYGWSVVGAVVILPQVGKGQRAVLVLVFVQAGALLVISWGALWALGVVVPVVPSLLAGIIAAAICHGKTQRWPFTERRKQGDRTTANSP